MIILARVRVRVIASCELDGAGLPEAVCRCAEDRELPLTVLNLV